MEYQEIINNLTLKAIDEMDLKKNLRSMKQREYEQHVLNTVLETYLKISYTVVNNKKPE